MTKVSIRSTINASAEDVWKTLRSFDRVERFLPLVISSVVQGSGVGAERTCSINFGQGKTSKVVEKLENIDEETYTIRFTVIDAPPPLRGTENTITVNEIDDNKSIVFLGEFDLAGKPEEETKKMIEGIYSMAFDGLRKLHEN